MSITFNVISFVIMGLLAEISFWIYIYYRFDKQREFENDERWQTILTKVKKVNSTYFDFVSISIVLGLSLFLMFADNNNPINRLFSGSNPVYGDSIYINIEIVVIVAFIVFIGRNVAKIIAFKHYNKTM